MVIPGPQELLRPVLKALSDGNEAKIHPEILNRVARTIGLSDEEREKQRSVKRPTDFYNRTGWATRKLKEHRLVDRSSRDGVYFITVAGSNLLKEQIPIDNKLLKERFSSLDGDTPSTGDEDGVSDNQRQTPEEEMASTYTVKEGSLVEKHLDIEYRVRNRPIVQEKKRKSKYICECCGFEFQKKYGTIGEEYIECHHVKPLADSNGVEEIGLEDLAALCSNCHRMIHRLLESNEEKYRNNYAQSVKDLRCIVKSPKN